MEQSIQSYTCPSCGGNLIWNIKKQSFECSSCRTPGDIDITGSQIRQHSIENYAARVDHSEEDIVLDSIRCKNCGAEVIFTDNRTATVCPMCGSPQINVTKQNVGIHPDGVIPFKIDRADAQESFRKWAKTRWFAPNKFKESFQEGKLEGVYLPCWTYDSDSEAHYRGRGGEVHTYEDKDGNTHTETRWFPVSGHVSTHVDDMMVYDGSTDAKNILKDGNHEFNTEVDAVPYLPPYLSGFNAEHYCEGAQVCFNRVTPVIESELISKAHSDILRKGYDQAQVTKMDVQHHNVEYKHLLLPAWISAFAYKGKQYTYLINGSNGNVSGKRPYSPIKIGLLILVIAALAVGAYFLFFRDNKKQQTQQPTDTQSPQSAIVEMAEYSENQNVLAFGNGRFIAEWTNAA